MTAIRRLLRDRNDVANGMVAWPPLLCPWHDDDDARSANSNSQWLCQSKADSFFAGYRNPRAEAGSTPAYEDIREHRSRGPSGVACFPPTPIAGMPVTKVKIAVAGA